MRFYSKVGHLFLVLLLACLASSKGKADKECLSRIRLPPGFSISSYADGRVPLARSLVLSEAKNGGKIVVYVSTRKDDRVYAVIDDDGDGIADHVHTVINDKYIPNGIAWRNGSLYVAQKSKIWRYDDVDSQAIEGKLLKNPELVSDVLPSASDHGWRYIGFGPDGKLYIPVGAPCNLCRLKKYGAIEYGSIIRMNPDGSGVEVFATGIRNSVGFDWHPKTNELWFTENGADSMGDNLPDDELNRAPRAGLNFGFPQCHTKGTGDPLLRPTGRGKDFTDPMFGPLNGCKKHTFERPIQQLGPHVAALGMRFYTGRMFPKKYRNSIFIAQRGSWDRDEPIGYRIAHVTLNKNSTDSIRLQNFAEGWLDSKTGDYCGRLVDVLQLKDGSLLVSDDDAGDVYRITYEKQKLGKRN